MNRLEINPNNEKYYSKEFIQGYKCGTKSQFDADAKVLEQIRAEIEQNAYPIIHGVNNHEKGMTLYGILQIIDKYRGTGS